MHLSTLGWLSITVGLLAALWAAILLANRKYDLKKRGFVVSPGLIMWHTKRGLHLIDRLSRDKRGWRVYGTVAIVAGIFLMGFVSLNLVINLYYMLTKPATALPGVQLVLPGLVPGLNLASWLIAIASVLVVHEFTHGFLLRAQGLQTKSVGGLLLVAIPGAFVEPNEKQLARAPILKRLRVFASGPFSNIVFSILCLAVVLLLIVPKPGAYVYAVVENYPAYNHEISHGMRIYSINNFEISDAKDFELFMKKTKPGENIRVLTSGGEKLITLAASPYEPDRGFLGVVVISAVSRWNFVNPIFVMGTSVSELMGNTVFQPYVFDAVVPWSVVDVVKWMFVLNLGIGLFNLLPAVPLDGGYMVRSLLEKKLSKERAMSVSKVISLFVLFLIIANFIPLMR